MMNGRRPTAPGHNSGRNYLTGREVERLIEATKGGRNEARDRCLVLLMFRHGLRVSEACRLTLYQVDTENLVLLHPECHSQVHSLKLEVVKLRPEKGVWEARAD